MANSNGINFCGGKGWLTDEQLKMKLERGHGNFVFVTVNDLSKDISVTPYGNRDVVKFDEYSQALACFIAFHTREILPYMSHFSGYDCVHFKCNFKIKN